MLQNAKNNGSETLLKPSSQHASESKEANLDVFSLFVNLKMPLKQLLSHANVSSFGGAGYAERVKKARS
jgi:hypothetical protein